MKSLYESIIGNTKIGIAASIEKWITDIYEKYHGHPEYKIKSFGGKNRIIFKDSSIWYVNNIVVRNNIPSMINSIFFNKGEDVFPCAIVVMGGCDTDKFDFSNLNQSSEHNDWFKFDAYLVFSNVNKKFTVCGFPITNEETSCNVFDCNNICFENINAKNIEIIFTNCNSDILDIKNCTLDGVSFAKGQLARYSTLIKSVRSKSEKVIYTRYGRHFIFVDNIQETIDKFVKNNKVSNIYYNTDNDESPALRGRRIKIEKLKTNAGELWGFKV